jgi:hypothetical protein
MKISISSIVRSWIVFGIIMSLVSLLPVLYKEECLIMCFVYIVSAIALYTMSYIIDFLFVFFDKRNLKILKRKE